MCSEASSLCRPCERPIRIASARGREKLCPECLPPPESWPLMGKTALGYLLLNFPLIVWLLISGLFLGIYLIFQKAIEAVPDIIQVPPRCGALAVTNDSEVRLGRYFREPEMGSVKQAFRMQTPLSSSKVRPLVGGCNCYDPFHHHTRHLRDTGRWTLASFAEAILEDCQLFNGESIQILCGALCRPLLLYCACILRHRMAGDDHQSPGPAPNDETVRVVLE